jgi:hypothetical protein
VRANASLLREMWRCAAALELLPAQTRTELGDRLIERLGEEDAASVDRLSDLWCVGRIGARQLFYGPNNQVLPAATALRWIDALVKLPGTAETVATVGRRTGDASRDLAPAALETLRRALHDQQRALRVLEGGDSGDRDFLARVFGEELPSGLVLAETGPGQEQRSRA